jgi:ribosomal protein S18 acetylase RimI-like enzyme
MQYKFSTELQKSLESLLSNKKVFEYDADASHMQDTSSIRPFMHKDLDRIVTIEKNCFKPLQAYSKKQLRYLTTKANSLTLVECKDTDIRGFIIVLMRSGSNIAGIETISVDPTHQGKGIASRLLHSISENLVYRGLKYIRLEVSIGNLTAIQLYKKMGYNTLSVLPNYYHNEHFGSRNAYRMVKPLPN